MKTITGHDLAQTRHLLASPFPEESIDWKPQTAGWNGDPEKGGKPWVKLLAFIDNRAIQERLDDVCGIGGWRNEFRPLGEGAMLCGLSILFEHLDSSREWVTKWDGAQATEIESVKGGISSAMKRAATQWGIGRYLYDVEVKFGDIAADNDWGAKQVTPKNKQKQEMKSFRWLPPRLPAWAQFGGSGKKGVVSTIQQERANAAERVLQRDDPADAIIPGGGRNFAGHGGKRVREVPTLALKRVQEDLRSLGSEKYTRLIEQIGEVLADRASSEST